MARIPLIKSLYTTFLLVNLVVLYLVVTKYSGMVKMRNAMASITTSRIRQFNSTSDKFALKNTLKGILHCSNEEVRLRKSRRGSYIIYSNYITSKLKFQCYESVTYATQGEYMYLYNLLEVAERWKGPVSASVYCPGGDYNNSMETILYLTNCYKTDIISQFVTFHLIFHQDHLPSSIYPAEFLRKFIRVNCSDGPPWINRISYRSENDLIYPVNVLRNTAKYASPTHFHLMSDIELYPSSNVIPKFLTLIANNKSLLDVTTPQVFVLPIFEVEENEVAPNSKNELIELVRKKRANRFHQYICGHCQRIPQFDKWLVTPENTTLSILTTTKREKGMSRAEPLFIGTKLDPEYDERLSWEGRNDKKTQVI